MKLTLFLLFMSISTFVSDKPAYQLFNQQGEKVTFSQMSEALREADIILFGELHNDPINHWLQLQLTKELYVRKQEDLILAAEMFEADDQLLLDEYIEGVITAKHLVSESKAWPNYETDYAPLVNFAREQKLKFVASNVPRRYASLVSRQGLPILETLSKEAQSYIAPLPIEVDMELPGYKKMMEMMGHSAHGGGGMRAENFVYAQALKDATMAAHILKHWKKGKQVIHFNGTYHSNNFEGIGWYLKQQNPKLKIMTIAAASQPELNALAPENAGVGHFVMVTPSDMTKTH